MDSPRIFSNLFSKSRARREPGSRLWHAERITVAALRTRPGGARHSGLPAGLTGTETQLVRGAGGDHCRLTPDAKAAGMATSFGLPCG